MLHLTTCLLFALIALPVQAASLVMDSGERQVTLLELYTSQGCSSCPPAERWLNDYVEDDALWQSIVPVAFHVDYWDYIGWKDPYATAANGERQRDYARAGHARTVYTPGFFTNGREWRGWTWRMGPRASRKRPGNLVVRVEDGQLAAQFPVTDKPLQLNIAVLGFGIETDVLRGENRNSTLRQEFVSLVHVTHPSVNGEWRVPLPDFDERGASRLGLAVWVSEPGHPAPLQATGGWLVNGR
ncbi:MAG: DUF1223 domain-containing protein [Halobacteria archaeon]|nr:DUF1223 domain-containing protein [Halobacteria archaeon]